MKFLGTAFLVMIFCFHAQAQQKNRYTLPKGLTTKDYVAGKVLVKVKPSAIASMTASSPSARSAMNIKKIKPLVPQAARNNAARLRAPKTSINLDQYFEITFDPTVSVDAYINDLLASGTIEYADPIFREQIISAPNDPFSSGQYYLDIIRAYEAWEITQGSEEIIIGIIDSGVDIDHPDLASQIYINDDPVNGIDDDNNGYVDDYRGWDFSGADVALIDGPNFKGDNNPSVFKTGPGFTHGTAVGACASASTNNNEGISGVGYHSKLLFTKHFADNQSADSRSYSSNLYDGIIYAAQNGARIINCSWGSNFRSQIYQDIITLVTLEYNCLVVAAAGNDDNDAPLYPAAYDYVLSVAATNGFDQKATFSNYGNTVDISAPGVEIFTAVFGDGYEHLDGTSFSSPIVAGAAALVLAHHPDLTPLQVGELLRVTADASLYDEAVNAPYLGGLGKGRLDIVAALSGASPSIRAMSYQLVNANNETPSPGEAAFLSFDFTNFLNSSTAALNIKIETSSSYVTITNASVDPGAIESNATINNSENPFELTIGNNVPVDEVVILKIIYQDAGYNDQQTFSFIPNPSFRTIEENLIITSISSNGRMGFSDPSLSSGGNGFVFDDHSLLYEMGLITGSSSATVLNNVRNGSGGFDTDFQALNLIQKIVPGERADAEVFGDFSNATNESSQKLKVNYRSLVWREEPHEKFVILEYILTNPTSATLNNFYFGIFADWDIANNGADDAAAWHEETQLGYVYPKQLENAPRAGIQLLTGNGKYYAIDNNQDISGVPFGIYDGFTDSEKFTSLSTNRLQAGASSAGGNDVSHVVSSGPHTIPPGQQVTIAFALHAAKNMDDLITSAKYADTLYQSIRVVTGIERTLEQSLTVYPNPTRNQAITVQLDGLIANDIDIALIDAKGQSLSQLHGTSGGSFSATIPTASYLSGLYFLKVKADNKVAVRKVVISR